MSELTTKSNLPAMSDYEGAGLDDITHADTPQKYVTLNKDTGVISIAGTDTILGDSKTAFKITPLFQYASWNYMQPDGMKVLGRELIHANNKNITFKDEELCMVTVDGKQTPALRRHCRTVLVLVSDKENQGPMFLSAMRSKKWAMEATLISQLLENKKKKLPIFGQEFLVTSEQKTNKKGQKFYTYLFKAGDYVKSPEKLASLFQLYMSLKDSQDKLVNAGDDSGDANEDKVS